MKNLLLAAALFGFLSATQAAPLETPATIAAETKPAKKARFEEDIEKFEASDLQKPPAKGGVVFIGSSSIRRWKTLKKDFPDSQVLNRGFGGSVLSDSLRYVHRIVTPYEPKMVVLYAGSNDVAGGTSPEKILANYREFVDEIREKLPLATVVFIPIAPSPKRWPKREAIEKANALIAEYTKTDANLKFLDVYSQMLDEKGEPRPELYIGDRLHMKSAGYEIWTKALKPLLPLKNQVAPAK